MTRLAIVTAVLLALGGCTATARAWLWQEHVDHERCAHSQAPFCQPNP